MPEALISITASPGPGAGSGNSMNSSWRSPRNTTAFMGLPPCGNYLPVRTGLDEAARLPPEREAGGPSGCRRYFFQ